jgi:hypothetical protein
VSAWLSRACFVSLLSFGACADPDVEVKVPTPDIVSFEATVYPILLRDCGFPACHGDTRRFFRIFGPGRTRYRPKEVTALFAPPTAEELTATYYRARSMLVSDGRVEDSPLLQKPLFAGHEGEDEWGQNVYWHPNDPSYQALLRWAYSQRGGPLPLDAGVGP